MFTTTVRFAGVSILLFAEIFLPNGNMIILIAFVCSGMALVLDKDRETHELNLVRRALCRMKQEVKSAVSKPHEQ